MLEPNSPLAKAIADLFTLTHLIGLGVFLLVTGLVLYAVVRFRARPGAEAPVARHGHTRLEIAWTVGPALLLVVLFTLMVDAMARSDPNPAPSARTADLAANPAGAPRVPDLVVIGHQWWWEIRYPGGITTANEIHLPTGRPITLQLESADVVHDLWVPKLGRKLDMNPGLAQYVTWQADAPGTFYGACAEYCGVEHAWMLMRAIAQPPAEYDAWLRAQAQPAAPPAPGPPERGAQLFRTRTCINCHAIRGTPATAQAGPDLTHVGSRSTIGAGVLDHTAENMRRWLLDPHAVKPGVYMPAVQLTADELSDLVAYMESLK